MSELQPQKKNNMTGKRVRCPVCGLIYKTNRELSDTCPRCGQEFLLWYNVI